MYFDFKLMIYWINTFVRGIHGNVKTKCSSNLLILNSTEKYVKTSSENTFFCKGNSYGKVPWIRDIF